MAGLEVWESVTLAGRPERARVARAFAVGVLGAGHPRGDDAALLASELFGNSVRHSRSGAAGGTVTVAVRTKEREQRARPDERRAGARQDGHPRNELSEAQGEWTELYREDESCTAVLIRPARAS